MSDNTPASFSPPPAPTSPSESIAAPAEVGQVEGTQASQKPVCRRGTCPAGRLCLACEFPMDLSDAGSADPVLEQFQRWLENKAHSSAAWVRNMEPLRFFAEDVFSSEELVVAECRAATKLLMQFKLEKLA